MALCSVSESVSPRATGSVVQVVPQNSSTGMFHWRQDITFQSQLNKTGDSTKPNCKFIHIAKSVTLLKKNLSIFVGSEQHATAVGQT